MKIVWIVLWTPWKSFSLSEIQPKQTGLLSMCYCQNLLPQRTRPQGMERPVNSISVSARDVLYKLTMAYTVGSQFEP